MTKRAESVASFRSLFRARHPRTANAAADLLWTWTVFAEFAREINVLCDDELASLEDRVVKALQEVCAAQLGHQQDTDPVDRYLELVSALLGTGQAHLADPTGDEPVNAERFGWRLHIGRGGSFQHVQPIPQGKCIGWTNGEEVYLEPISSYAEARRLADAQDEPFSMSRTTLQQRLDERGLLAARDVHHLCPKRLIQGARRRVLIFKVRTLGLDDEGGATGADGADVVSNE